jgi:hypothetical protein
MTANQNNIGTVWKVFLKPDEEKEVLELLELNGLPKNEAGFKELFFRLTVPPEKGSSRLVNFVAENPEVVDLAQKSMQTAGALIRKKIFGK